MQHDAQFGRILFHLSSEQTDSSCREEQIDYGRNMKQTLHVDGDGGREYRTMTEWASL